jgi:methionine synthase II (cobalamin-independent)
MRTDFKPACLPALIGSLPMEDHEAAVSLMSDYTPDIPLWIQLPRLAKEGMMAQFLPGMPGIMQLGEKIFIDAGGERFEEEVLSFFEEYMAVSAGEKEIGKSCFALSETEAAGFFTFLRYLEGREVPPVAVKAQITGPFTFATGVVDHEGKALFYDDQLRDIAVKQIAMKARWQVSRMKNFGVPVIVFLDEPGLAGFGSSAFISVSRQDVDHCLAEVMEAIHAEGGIAGIHVCANSEWSIVLDSAADIASFDAYSFFDKFLLYKDEIIRFLSEEGILAWGLVPTGEEETIRKETVSTLFARWEDSISRLAAMGLERDSIFEKSLITPSCGTGSLSIEGAERVLELTRDLSGRIRQDRPA